MTPFLVTFTPIVDSPPPHYSTPRNTIPSIPRLHQLSSLYELAGNSEWVGEGRGEFPLSLSLNNFHFSCRRYRREEEERCIVLSGRVLGLTGVLGFVQERLSEVRENDGDRLGLENHVKTRGKVI